MTKPTTTFQTWKLVPPKLQRWRKNRSPKPPLQNNPSLTGGKHNRFAKPVSLPKVWK